MSKYRTTGTITMPSGVREEIKIVQPRVSRQELLEIEAQNGMVPMPSAEERERIEASRQYDETFISDDWDDLEDDD